jgi:hypothetical protein
VSSLDNFQLKKVDHKSLLEFKEYLRVMKSRNLPVEKKLIVSETAQVIIATKLMQKNHCNEDNARDWVNCPSEDDDNLVKALLTYFPKSDNVAVGSLDDQVKALKIDYHPDDPTSIHSLLDGVNQIWDRLPADKQTLTNMENIGKLLQPMFKASGPKGLMFGERLAQKMATGGHPKSVLAFGARLMESVETLKAAYHEMEKCFGSTQMKNFLHNSGGKSTNGSAKVSKPNNGGGNSSTEPCGGCGRDHPKFTKSNCPFKAHPDWNSANVPFVHLQKVTEQWKSKNVEWCVHG